MKKIVVLSGAGISAESGISTFRGSGGLWEGHDVTQVASREGWDQDNALVLDFYNKRRRQIMNAEPNLAHLKLAELEEWFDIEIITQNVDDLHERAGSSKVLHLHGEITKAKCNDCIGREIIIGYDDLYIGDCCPKGHQLRPDIVWFGEPVWAMDLAVSKVRQATIVLVIGTSLEVYPAAGLAQYADAELYLIDPNANLIARNLNRKVVAYSSGAVEGIDKWIEDIK